MKVNYRASEKLSFEFETEDVKDVFRKLALVEETFCEECCGACKSTSLKFVARKVEDDEFFEMHCNKCHSKLAFGIAKADGKLYPKRMETDGKGKAIKGPDGKGKFLPNAGWFKWVPKEE